MYRPPQRRSCAARRPSGTELSDTASKTAPERHLRSSSGDLSPPPQPPSGPDLAADPRNPYTHPGSGSPNASTR
jgi:hypothetical protein